MPLIDDDLSSAGDEVVLNVVDSEVGFSPPGEFSSACLN